MSVAGCSNAEDVHKAEGEPLVASVADATSFEPNPEKLGLTEGGNDQV